MMQEQVGMLRMRQMIAGFEAPDDSPLKRTGFLASIGVPMIDRRPVGALQFNADGANELAATKTQLRGLEDRHIQRLTNWGYILADDRLRSRSEFSHVAPPAAPPYPETPV
jgi:hypothetical protein